MRSMAGGGVSASLSERSADTPTPAPPHKGEGISAALEQRSGSPHPPLLRRVNPLL